MSGEDNTYVPKRPKSTFSVAWFLVGLIIMLGLRAGVQFYIHQQTAAIETSKAAVEASGGEMETAQKAWDDAWAKQSELESEQWDLDSTISRLEGNAERSEDEQTEYDTAVARKSALETELAAAAEALTAAETARDALMEKQFEKGSEELKGMFGAGLGIIVAYMVFAPFCYFLGALIIGWRSPGNTIIEPALAAVLVVLAIAGWEVSQGAATSVPCIGCSSIFSFVVALLGGIIGEKIQGPAAAA